ncbi:MAG: phosphotransferase [Dehalococcoidia bacterium]|nr:phosphotransferase [Dehalococcoidia bacterium]
MATILAPAVPGGDRPAIEEALGAFGIEQASVEPLSGGAVNEHWRVDAPGLPARVLRRYHPRQTQDSVAYEHRLLQYLANRDWPVAPAIVAGGGSQLETEAGRWALFPFVHGDPPANTRRSLQRKGALLALLHVDLRDYPETEQRPGFGRITDLDTPLRLDGFADFHALIAWDALRHPERAHAFEALRERNLEDARARGYDDLPDHLVYFECLGNNILFDGDDVSAMLDFDQAHRDARVADLGRSLLTDGGLDGWSLHAFLAGYQAHGDPPLTRQEVDLLPTMMLAAEIWNTAHTLAMSDRHPADWMEQSIEQSLTVRLPRLEAAQDELREVLRGAGGYPTL